MLSRYRLVDYATQGYLLFVALVALAWRGDHWVALVATHLVVVAGLHALISRQDEGRLSEGAAPSAPSMDRGFWGYLRELYPILLYTGCYTEIAIVNRLLGTPRLDPWLLRADHALFGCQPAVEFPAAATHPLFSELMHVSYLSYYLLVGGVGVWLLVQNTAAFRHFVTVVSLVFYACYAIYLFVPAVGPRVLFADTPERAAFVSLYGHAPAPAPAADGGEPARRIFGLIERHAEIPGAAFPSSHVAVAFVTAWFSWRYLRRVRWVHLLFAVSIVFSTVYTQAHYAVDVLGGLIALAVFLPAAQALYARAEGSCRPASHGPA
ncbi:MAG: phosphatase PAP2 family protein [Verrucomicrobia bacterium]|nr:phosphatase PAP2 family protein [Verrucomicrobiota bacterium]